MTMSLDGLSALPDGSMDWALARKTNPETISVTHSGQIANIRQRVLRQPNGKKSPLLGGFFFFFFSRVAILAMQFLVDGLANALEDLAPLFRREFVYVLEVEEVGAGVNVRLLGLGWLLIWHERIISVQGRRRGGWRPPRVVAMRCGYLLLPRESDYTRGFGFIGPFVRRLLEAR
jgi:hypothetical protein